MNKHDPNTPAPLLPHSVAKRFEDILERLLTGKNLNLHENDLSSIFEAIATNLFTSSPQFANCYFDRVTDLTLPRTINFKAEM